MFIKKCEENNIKILNGYDITYFFNGEKHVYKVDFFLPSERKLVEIKENHIWHKKQIESGKWDAKKCSAIEFAKSNNMEYVVLFNEDFSDFFLKKK